MVVDKFQRSVVAAGRVHIGMLVLAAFVLLLGILLGIGAAVMPRGSVIARGVAVNGMPIGGMTRAQAAQKLTHALANMSAQKVTLEAGGKTRTMRLSELGFQPQIAKTVNAAYAIGRERALFERLVHSAKVRMSGKQLRPTFSFNETTAKAILVAYGQSINRLPADASARWNGSAVVITPEHRGAKLDVPASVKLVRATYLNDLSTGRGVREQLKLPYREKIPRVTAEMLEPVDTVLGQYSTSYGTSSRNRAQNVDVAAKAIDRVVLLPDETFSFNKTVGPRNSSNGFTIAPVIVNGQLEPGFGGGVCQVSTTLYNAVLLANLEIVSRSHHSLPSHYVPVGLDATVSYGSLDFQFKNSTDAPVVIESLPRGRRLLVRILGKGPAPEVQIVRSNISTFPGRTATKKDPTLPKGTRVVDNKGTTGKTVTVTRIVGHGASATREVLSRDRYPGGPTIIRIGTGTAPAPKPDQTVNTNPTEPHAMTME